MNLVLHDHLHGNDGLRREFTIQVYKSTKEGTWTFCKRYDSQALLDLHSGMLRPLIEKDIEMLVAKLKECADDPTP